jgi:hypothetical protein
VHNFFLYMNADVCELGFQHISTLYCPVQRVWFWEGLQKILSNKTFYFSVLQSVSGGGRFVPVVMVVERGDATGVLVCF